MSESTSLLGQLSIPKQQKQTSAAVDTRPKHVEQWVDVLPRANVGETAKLIYKYLHAINRTELPNQDRFKVLEILREPTEFVSEALKKNFIGLPLPLATKKLKVALLARELQAEMAIGYKIIIENKLSGTGSRIDTKTFITSIHRAIWYLSNILIKSYQIYLQAPDNVWKEIHRLFAYAKEKDFHKTIIKNQLVRQIRDTSLNNLYKQIVLLALANPYRLRQSDIERVYLALEHWAQYSELNDLVDPDQQRGMYSVNFNSDDPPGFFTHTDDPHMGIYNVLDTAELIKVLQNHITHYREFIDDLKGNRQPLLSQQILRRLLLSWGGMAKRIFSRTRKNTKVLVTFGLGTTHHFIYEYMKSKLEAEIQADAMRLNTLDSSSSNWNSDPRYDHKKADPGVTETFSEPEWNGRSQFTSTPIYTMTQPAGRSKDVWDPFYNKDIPEYGDYSLDFVESGNKSTTLADGTVITYESHICTSVNESAGGFCLVWVPWEQEHTPISALVGDIVGIRDLNESNENQWGIGVIRWMKNVTTKRLELGVQKLAPHAIAAGTVLEKKGEPTEKYMRSLLLPELKAISQAMTVITPTSHKLGTILKLSVFGDEKYIKLTKTLESTGSFTHYEFEDREKQPKQSKKEVNEFTDFDFDSLWPSID